MKTKTKKEPEVKEKVGAWVLSGRKLLVDKNGDTIGALALSKEQQEKKSS